MSKKTKILLGGLILGRPLLAGLSYSIFGDLPDIRALPDHLNRPSIRITERTGDGGIKPCHKEWVRPG
jgi:hypothetical protein